MGRIDIRARIFVYDLIILTILAVLGYAEIAGFLESVVAPHRLTFQAMWFGALGGVTISLKGVYEHGEAANPWKNDFNLWHLGRPVSGALAGLMTLLILHVLNQKGLSTGEDVKAAADALAKANIDLSAPNRFLVYVACFVFGTQEKRFFNLLYEVARLIVAVPDDAAAAGLRISGIAPDSAAAGDIVVLRGRGIAKQATASLGGLQLAKIQIADDGSAIAGEVPPGLHGADPFDAQVSNPDGVSFLLKGKFKLKTP